MEFKARIGNNLIGTMAMPIVALILAILGFVNDAPYPGQYTIIFVIIFFIAVLRLIVYGQYIYLVLFKKPVLITSENCIYDVVKNVKYKRADIEKLYVDNRYLYIQLHADTWFLNKTNDPVGHFPLNPSYATSVQDTLYKINLDFVDIDQYALSKIIDKYITKALETRSNEISNDFITYNFKWGKTMLSQSAFQIVMLLLALVYFKTNIISYIIGWFWIFLVGAVALPRFIKCFYFAIKKKPVLTADEFFIFDQFENIKYYWDDIDEIVPFEHYLQIKLYKPERYIDKIKNPFYRSLKQIGYTVFRRTPSYSIDLNIVAIEKEENQKFLDTLNKLSSNSA
jgi:hypothetical protein